MLDYKHVSDISQNEHYISDVVYWNATISEGKEMQRDFFVGIFIPNIYDDFDIITLNNTAVK